MSAADLVFTISGNLIYDPLQISGAPITVTVQNNGVEDLIGLGMYIQPATSLGDVDAPASYPPEQDYEDLLQWGTDAIGGLQLDLPTNGGPVSTTVTHLLGSKSENKLDFQDLPSGASKTFDITFNTPAGEPSRRFFIDLVLE